VLFLTPPSPSYNSRDAYYFERLFVLSDSFPSLFDLLQVLDGDLISLEDGIVFVVEKYKDEEGDKPDAINEVEEEEVPKAEAEDPAPPPEPSSISNPAPPLTLMAPPSTPEQKASIFRPTEPTSRPPSHRRGVTTPIPSISLDHLQQQRPLFSPKGHRRRRSSGSRRIKNLWKKEKRGSAAQQQMEEQYMEQKSTKKEGKIKR